MINQLGSSELYTRSSIEIKQSKREVRGYFELIQSVIINHFDSNDYHIIGLEMVF
jgi:hypothetical protein